MVRLKGFLKALSWAQKTDKMKAMKTDYLMAVDLAQEMDGL